MCYLMQLVYLGIQVPDLLVLMLFFGEVIGLVFGVLGLVGMVTWRNDDKAQRVIVEFGLANDGVFVGFDVDGDEAFDALVARLVSVGFRTAEGSDDERLDRRVTRLVWTMAFWGVAVELTIGLGDAVMSYASALMLGGFLTDGVGFGYVVFVTIAFDESYVFVTDGFGMEQSDWLETEIVEGIELEVCFYHCNPCHHIFVLVKVLFELFQKLHHLMLEANICDDVGVAFDWVWTLGFLILNGFGVHDNDCMFSFYVASLVGFMVEVGHGVCIIIEDWDDNRRYDRISAWGYQPLRQP